MATIKLRNNFYRTIVTTHGQTIYNIYNIKFNRENNVERNMSDIRFRIYANQTR